MNMHSPLRAPNRPLHLAKWQNAGVLTLLPTTVMQNFMTAVTFKLWQDISMDGIPTANPASMHFKSVNHLTMLKLPDKFLFSIKVRL